MSPQPSVIDLQVKEMLEKVVKKIENSPVLNGGFDRLVISVEHITTDQKNISNKLDDLSLRLYEPDDGFFSRITIVEKNDKNLDEHTKHDEIFQQEIKKVVGDALAQDSTKQESVKTTIAKLESIAGGKELSELDSIIKLKKTMQKFTWLIVAASIEAVGKILYDVYVAFSHHI